jgi:hypothetical protein
MCFSQLEDFWAGTMIIALVYKKNDNFSAEDWRKSTKKLIITLAPDEKL